MRFKWILLSILLISLLLHVLAFVPIIFIQIALDKVVGYKATSTLTVLTVGVVLALLFNSIFGYVRDYLIRHISGAIEARLSGDVFDKILNVHQPRRRHHQRQKILVSRKVLCPRVVRLKLKLHHRSRLVT